VARIYVTHCSHKKDYSYKGSGELVSPDLLYTAAPTRRFMQRCKARRVPWAIFSDLYGIWFPEVRHEWYEKDPNTVAETEFLALLRHFDEKLAAFIEIVFYYNPGRFHPLYCLLLDQSILRVRIKRITHLREIV
jgi:hypothetical protein